MTVGEKMSSDEVDALYRLLGYSNLAAAISYEGVRLFGINCFRNY